MRILSIETSCDETGISIIEASDKTITILGNALASQIDIHAQYGGVFPALAKRAHAEKIVPLLTQALTEAQLLEKIDTPLNTNLEETKLLNDLAFLDQKETDLKAHLVPFLVTYQKPAIDCIAVTTGPGLEPALWVGINTAKALSLVWGIPVIPINHMEGHVLVTLLKNNNETNNIHHAQQYTLQELQFPALALLVSGGHTELVLIEDYGVYKKIGQTQDDAVGEAFDKVARVLGVPYPGGPMVSKLAETFRSSGFAQEITLPRPMLHSGDYNFSYSGIKTAVLYKVRDITEAQQSPLTDIQKQMIACAFEDAAIEVLVKKTLRAIDEYHTQTIIVGGGVAANTYLRSTLAQKVPQTTTVLFPEHWLSTDNSVMIAIAAYLNTTYAKQSNIVDTSNLRADGNLSITEGGFRNN